MSLVDLHTHTDASDGLYSPEELLDKAIDANIQTIAITDHDTVCGLPVAQKYAENNGINLIPGVELSIDYDSGTYHLVGLFIDYENEPLKKELKRLNELRDTRAKRIVEDLAKYKVFIPYDDVEEEAKGGAIGRPHIARVLVKHGYGRNITEIFQNYLVNDKPGYVPKDKISADQGINLIRNAGGISIIAHPTSLELSTLEAYEKFFIEQIDRGVDGIEIYSAMHSDEMVEQFKVLTTRHNLLVSGGSDFHGDKNEVLGQYGDDRDVPSFVVERMKNYISG